MFIDFDICHRMALLRMLYSVISEICLQLHDTHHRVALKKAVKNGASQSSHFEALEEKNKQNVVENCT